MPLVFTFHTRYDEYAEERQEYRWIMDDNKQIDHIEPFEKMLSQKLVEECMIAANRCAARFLNEHGASGPYVTHPGFRGDRLDEIRKFLEMHVPEAAEQDPTTVAGYRAIIRALSAPEHPLPLRPMINRLLTRAELAASPGPHMGMALEHYTNCTSPLRKYVDFLVHLQIKAALHGDEARMVDDPLLEQLTERISTVRAATLEAERWLAGKHLARMNEQREGMTFKGKVVHVNSSGFNVRLDDNGLEGFVDLRKDPEKFSYDKWTASLTSTTRRFQLEQPVELRFTAVDRDNQHQASFELVEGCGLKPPKEEKKAAAE